MMKMKFKSWRDYYIFVKDFAKYSCLNCRHCGKHLNLDEEHSDTAYSNHFCIHWVAMVRWDLQGFVCSHWESSDGDKLPDDDTLFNLGEHILKKLEKGNRKWSIEEIKELIS